MEIFHGLECKVPLWGHQKQAAERAKDRLFFGFFFEVGAGKTAAAITTARFKYEAAQRLLRTMIFGPPVVLGNWRRELEMHLPDHLHKYIHIVYGSGKEREKKLLEILGSAEPYIIITNYESVGMPAVFKLLKDLKPELLIKDELHRCKSRTTKRFKKMCELADLAKIKLGLTGTLITNDAMDLWAQYRLLDGGATFGKNFFAFRSEYFYDKNAGMPKQSYFPDWKVRKGALEEFNRRISETGMVKKKEECLDLPPLLSHPVPVELGVEQANAYKAMKDEMIAAFDSGDVALAEFALTKSLRLQQIVSGFVTLDSGEVKVFKENPRIEALKDLLEDLTPASKVIVWATFHQNYADIRRVCESLKVKYVELHGQVNGKEREANIQAFNEDENVRVLIGHPGSGGIGVNLIASNHSIYYSRNFSLEQYIQSEGRNYRGGSERHQKVTHTHIYAANTIDEDVANALTNKQAISDTILRGFIREKGDVR
jgi:SNF2 family DNA or RNA helicase